MSSLSTWQMTCVRRPQDHFTVGHLKPDGEQSVHPAPPIYFCNLQLKVTLQTVRLLLTHKFSKIPPLYTFFDKYLLHKVIL